MALFPAKILVAVDGTEKGRRATDAAAELAAVTSSEVLLVHVKLLSHEIAGDTPSPALHDQRQEEGRELLDGEVGYLQEIGGTASMALVRMGRDIETELVRVATEVGAHVLVLGTRARRPGGRQVHVGRALDVVRDSPCSVWFVREEPRPELEEPPPLRSQTTVTHRAEDER